MVRYEYVVENNDEGETRIATINKMKLSNYQKAIELLTDKVVFEPDYEQV